MPTPRSDASGILPTIGWPEREEEVTADRLIVHGAGLAMMYAADQRELSGKAFKLTREDPEWEPAMRRYLDALMTAVAEAQVVIALVEVQKRSREEADALARRLWFLTEDGGALHELVWDYLNERGVDANAVWAAAQQDAQRDA